MKVLTKEILKNFELHVLYCALNTTEKSFLPVLLFSGGYDGFAKSDIITVKSQFNLTDKENEVSFIILPSTFTFFNDYYKDEIKQKRSAAKEFLSEYINRLRIISELPEKLLKRVKDKRLLALGYAEPKVKKNISKYAYVKKTAVLTILEKSNEESVNACSGLTIEEQFENNNYINSIVELFEETTITNVYKFENDIFIELDDDIKIVLISSKIIEEEKSPINAYIKFFELHRGQEFYELHLLLMTKDSNLVEHFHYVTYRFKDMRIENK